MTTKTTPRDTEQAEQFLRFNRTLPDLLSSAMSTYAADVNVRDLVNNAEHVIGALECVDDDQTLPAAEPERWQIGCALSDSEHDGMRALGICMLADVCADHPEVTGPLLTRLAHRLRQGLLDD